MNNFIGNWKLETNDNNFDKFLKFYEYSYCMRKLILCADISVTIYNNTIDDYNIKSLYKTIHSKLYSADELFIFDNKWYDSHENLIKKHELIDDKIYSEINVKNKKNIKWIEIIYIKDNKLYVKRKWKENNIENESIQMFIKIYS